MKNPDFEFIFHAVVFFCIVVALLLYIWIEWIYPLNVKRRIKKLERYETASFAEYKTSFMGYLGTLGPLLLCVVLLMVGIVGVAPEKRVSWEYVFLITLSTVGTMWFIFKLIYILPRRYFKWENNVIYYHTGLREKVITEIKHIFRHSPGRTNYFSVEIWEDKKPNIYVDILSLQHPKKIYSILKVKSKAEHEFY